MFHWVIIRYFLENMPPNAKNQINLKDHLNGQKQKWGHYHILSDSHIRVHFLHSVTVNECDCHQTDSWWLQRKNYYRNKKEFIRVKVSNSVYSLKGFLMYLITYNTQLAKKIQYLFIHFKWELYYYSVILTLVNTVSMKYCKLNICEWLTIYSHLKTDENILNVVSVEVVLYNWSVVIVILRTHLHTYDKLCRNGVLVSVFTICCCCPVPMLCILGFSSFL